MFTKCYINLNEKTKLSYSTKFWQQKILVDCCPKHFGKKHWLIGYFTLLANQLCRIKLLWWLKLGCFSCELPNLPMLYAIQYVYIANTSWNRKTELAPSN